MNKVTKLFSIVVFALILLSGGFQIVKAQSANNSCGLKQSGLLGMPTWYKYLKGEKAQVETKQGNVSVCTVKLYGNDLSSDKLNSDSLISGNILAKNISAIGLAIVEILMRLLIYLSLIWGIWGSYEMIVSGGNSQSFKSGIDKIKNAGIGLIIGLLSTSITIFVAKSLV